MYLIGSVVSRYVCGARGIRISVLDLRTILLQEAKVKGRHFIMDWKLVFGLSLLGLAMAIATVSLIPSNIEPLFWLAVFLLCGFVIARRRSSGHFVHGLLVGLLNSLWVTSVHVVFFSQYLSNHPKEAGMTKSMPLSNSPRLMMALVGPVIGVVSGVVIGLIAYGMGKFVRPRIISAA